MSDVDTSTAAVEKMCVDLENDAEKARRSWPEMFSISEDDVDDAAALLRALAAERDTLAEALQFAQGVLGGIINEQGPAPAVRRAYDEARAALAKVGGRRA